MSQADSMEDLGSAAHVLVAVSALSPSSFRSTGLCDDQVERLVSLRGAWPPIVVGRDDGIVIDGAHRVAAARRLGMARLPAVLFAGGPEDAFVEFVRRNVVHGLALSLGERKQAAARVLRVHPNWSDRRVAELCALSPKTVGRLRSDEAWSAAQQESREGRDGRIRPARRGSVRGRVLEAIRAQPEASLRTIAAQVGVSPETVRLVRLNMTADCEPLAVEPGPAVHGTLDEPAEEPERDWRSDAALRSCDAGDGFLAWFERTAVHGSDVEWVEAVPLSRVYLIAEEARRRSETWLELARAFEARPARAR